MLPEIGKISMKDVNIELKRIENSKINLNEEEVRKLADKPIGTIGMEDLRGKSNLVLVHEKIILIDFFKVHPIRGNNLKEHVNLIDYYNKIPDFDNGTIIFEEVWASGDGMASEDVIYTDFDGIETSLSYYIWEYNKHYKIENCYKITHNDIDYVEFNTEMPEIIDLYGYYEYYDYDGTYSETSVGVTISIEADFYKEL